MRQRLRETDPFVSFIARTNRSLAALTCGLNVMVMSLSYANRGTGSSRDGVTEEHAVVRASDDSGPLAVYMLRFSDDGVGHGGLDT